MNDLRMILMSQEWDEWLLNDMNESRMRWMTVEWCEWLLNDVNDSRMIWMSLKWDEWLLNDVNDMDCFPLMGAESRGTQEVVQAILSHSETYD